MAKKKTTTQSEISEAPIEKDYNLYFEYVCLEIEKGRALRKCCADFMSVDKFHLMCKENKSLNERYARAREIQAENIFDDMLSIADENARDKFVDHNGIERTDNDVIQRSRLMIDTRKWMLAKMAPKRYGDKLDVEHSGEVGIVWQEEKTYEANAKTNTGS